MNREDVIRLVEQAGNGKVRDPFNTHMFFYDELERFAALVASAEREACAQICEQQSMRFDKSKDWHDDYHEGALSCVRIIRARGVYDE